MSKPIPIKRPRSVSRPLPYLEASGLNYQAHDLPQGLNRTTSRNSTTTTPSYRGSNTLGEGLSRVPSNKLGRSKSRRIEEESTKEGDNVELSAGRTSIDGSESTAVVGKKSPIEEEASIGIEEDDIDLEEDEEVYKKFSEKKKNLIVKIVAYSALLAPFSSSSFLPSIPSISRDLNTTATLINISIACFIIVLSFFPLIYAPYATIYGRRNIYLISLPIFTLGSLGAALAPNFIALFILRLVQAAGSSAVLSVGAGSITDLYPRRHRGSAMGLYYGMILIGPASAPAIAGVLTEYAPGQGWRAMQFLLAAMGALATILVFCFLDETIHHKGVDSIRNERRLKREAKSQVELVKERESLGVVGRWLESRDFVVVWLNPVAPLRLLVHPHIVAVSLNCSFVLMSTYTVLVPLSQTLAPRYNITNTAILGCVYLASGTGNILAGRLTGMYSDHILAVWFKRRGSVYVPEDRLRAALIGGGGVLPIAVLSLGWVLEKGTGTSGLVISILLLVLNGMGLMMVLTPSNTYCVDTFPTRSAEVIAVNNSLRYLLSAAASAFVLPLIDTIGVGWTNTFSAALCWVGFILVLLTIRYGEKWRELGAKWENYEEEDYSQTQTVEIQNVKEEVKGKEV